ncbi:hypothetical protein EUGRSUZ_F02260 [Eucalyptus grandis]|uniref:adenine phosphoribosyltransferase n=2 Tax=Eucalyptus grandis TaxID=71139 RepID=A0A059BRS4_EUCGR|nr:hypothetical protein EUGRSUZ_F02260 [Eucalyptus grandis]
MLSLQKLATSLSAPLSRRIEARSITRAPPGTIAAAHRRRGTAGRANRGPSLSSGMATSFEHSNGVRKVAKAARDQHMASQGGQDPRLAKIASSIRVIPDFPKPGIMFQDITTLLLNPEAFKDTIDLFVERYREQNISVVAGVEARGFIFGPPIALAIGAKFVPMRNPQITGEVISEEYSLEYGTDTMEMHVGAVQPGDRALIVDDLIATERVGAEVVECACAIELPELKGRDRLGDKPLFVLVSSDI